jgi:deoxyribodipyrimidine photolyase-related protein
MSKSMKHKDNTKYIHIHLVLLPNQLFSLNKIIKKIEETLIIQQTRSTTPTETGTASRSESGTGTETKSVATVSITVLDHPVFYGKRKRIGSLNFNKLKMVYQHATVLNYLDELHIKSQPVKITNIEHIKQHQCKSKSPLLSLLTKTTQSIKTRPLEYLVFFDPVDHQLYDEIHGIIKKSSDTTNKIIYLDSLLFLDTRKDLEEFHTKHNKKKSFYHASFYAWQKKHLDVLANTKSYDDQNRNKMPLSVSVPSLPSTGNSKSKQSRLISQSIAYVNKYFPKNYGDCSGPETLKFPITREDAVVALRDFCKNRLSAFGKYQDAIDAKGRNFLFHSCISPMLNIGLITPDDVISVVGEYYKEHSAVVGIANYEGFMRQVIGWREYQRYCYLYGYKEMVRGNYFGNSRKLDKRWYTGDLGVLPVDDAIKMAWHDGYLHHILRLMVVANFMNLRGIHPDEAYKWFMEFSLDSYDWVMIQNIYGMGMWSDGGLSMRKPYISGDGYIMKMSTYTKEKDIVNKETGDLEHVGWNTKWYSAYYDFVNRNRDALKGTYYAGMVKNYDKKSTAEKERIAEVVKGFL